MVVQKRCSLCSKQKPSSDFYRDSHAADGLRGKCKECDVKVRRSNRQKVYGELAARRVGKEPKPLPASPAERARQAAAEQKEYRDFRAEHSALVSENEAMRKELDTVRKLSAPPNVIVYKKPKHLREDAVACMVASDWHVEEPVDAESVNGLNSYSLEVARSRGENFFKNGLRLTDICARDSKVGTILLSALGDFFTNYLHEENREMNDLPPEEAARFAQDILASGISYWLKESGYRIIVDCVAGNHGRMTEKRRAANHAGTSLETYMYHSLARSFDGNPRVEFKVARSKMLYRSFFERLVIREIHGDDIGYQGGIGGVTIPIRKKIASWDKGIRASITVMGHFHQLLHGGDFIVNGSLIGFSPYSQSLGATPEEARQAFYLATARNGGEVSIFAPVWLDSKHHTGAAVATNG
jgi:hypothetical protein